MNARPTPSGAPQFLSSFVPRRAPDMEFVVRLGDERSKAKKKEKEEHEKKIHLARLKKRKEKVARNQRIVEEVLRKTDPGREMSMERQERIKKSRKLKVRLSEKAKSESIDVLSSASFKSERTARTMRTEFPNDKSSKFVAVGTTESFVRTAHSNELPPRPPRPPKQSISKLKHAWPSHPPSGPPSQCAIPSLRSSRNSDVCSYNLRSTPVERPEKLNEGNEKERPFSAALLRGAEVSGVAQEKETDRIKLPPLTQGEDILEFELESPPSSTRSLFRFEDPADEINAEARTEERGSDQLEGENEVLELELDLLPVGSEKVHVKNDVFTSELVAEEKPQKVSKNENHIPILDQKISSSESLSLQHFPASNSHSVKGIQSCSRSGLSRENVSSKPGVKRNLCQAEGVGKKTLFHLSSSRLSDSPRSMLRIPRVLALAKGKPTGKKRSEPREEEGFFFEKAKEKMVEIRGKCEELEKRKPPKPKCKGMELALKFRRGMKSLKERDTEGVEGKTSPKHLPSSPDSNVVYSDDFCPPSETEHAEDKAASDPRTDKGIGKSCLAKVSRKKEKTVNKKVTEEVGKSKKPPPLIKGRVLPKLGTPRKASGNLESRPQSSPCKHRDEIKGNTENGMIYVEEEEEMESFESEPPRFLERLRKSKQEMSEDAGPAGKRRREKVKPDLPSMEPPLSQVKNCELRKKPLKVESSRMRSPLDCIGGRVTSLTITERYADFGLSSLEDVFGWDVPKHSEALTRAMRDCLMTFESFLTNLNSFRDSKKSYKAFIKIVVGKLESERRSEPAFLEAIGGSSELAKSTLSLPDFSCRYYKVVQSKAEVYDVVSRALANESGEGGGGEWHELPDCGEGGEVWNVLWTWGRPKVDFGRLLRWQKVNHFPDNKYLVRKDYLKRCQDRFTHSKGAESPFFIMPETFGLPKQYVNFVNAFSRDMERIEANQPAEGGRKEENLWIMKPVGASRGRGIKLIGDASEVTYAEPTVIQKYISKPFLLDGFKFDLRLFVLVTSFKPLEAWVYKDGFARMATEPYKLEDGQACLKNKFMHLTNTSINRRNHKEYLEHLKKPLVRDRESTAESTNMSPRARQLEAVYGGTKISLGGLRSRLSTEKYQRLWDESCLVILKALVMCEPDMESNPHSFELFGFDLMPDEDGRMWLLEVNSSPSMHLETLLDEKIKIPMVRDCFQLVDPLPFDREALVHVLKRRLKKPSVASEGGGWVGQGPGGKGGLESPQERQFNLDMHAVLGGKRPRRVGEPPANPGNYLRLAPGALHEKVVGMRKSLFSEGVGGGQLTKA